MEDDTFDIAIAQLMKAADGDMRSVLRAVLIENVKLQSELRHLYAVSEHGKPAAVTLH
jgi:hypothetical protein